jgi:hypothetical protein
MEFLLFQFSFEITLNRNRYESSIKNSHFSMIEFLQKRIFSNYLSSGRRKKTRVFIYRIERKS